MSKLFSIPGNYFIKFKSHNHPSIVLDCRRSN